VIAIAFASMDPVAVSEIERAQGRVAEVVHRLDAAGEIEVLKFSH